jgi:4-amino-4-deoxy-L-arabinose transferase-like glycosyltransferase
LADDLVTAKPPAASRTPLLVILLLGGLLRVVLGLGFPNVGLHDDEKDYNELAVNLVQRGEYLLKERTSSLRPPLYPAFVAGIYWVAGVENYQAVRLVQIGLSLLTALLVYGLGTELYDRRVGLLACGLYTFYPSWVGFSNLLYTEVLFTLLLCAACYLVARFFRSGSIVAQLVPAGVCLGLAALTRSVVWLFPPVLCLVLVAGWQAPLGRRLLAAGTLAAAFALTISPWVVRNTRLEQTLIVIDTMGGRNFLMGNYEYTPEHRAWDAVNLPYEQSWRYEVNQAYPKSERDTEGKLDKLALRQGLKFVRDNPGITLRRDVIKFVQFWGLERELIAQTSDGYFGSVPTPMVLLLTVVIFGSYVCALLTGVCGAVLAPPADKRVHVFLLLLIGFVCGMHTLVFGHSRYHLPLMPLILIYSASALVHRRQLWQRRGSWSFWRAVGLCAVFIAGWTWEITVNDLDRFRKLLHLAT